MKSSSLNMVSKDVGRLIVLSAFVALCAVVLFSSEVDARGYGDVSPYKGSVKRIDKGERRGYAYGLKNRRRGLFRKYGRRGNKKNRGYGRNLRKSLRKYRGGKQGRGYGRRFGGKWRGRRYRGKKNKGLKGKKYRGKANKGYPKRRIKTVNGK